MLYVHAAMDRVYYRYISTVCDLFLYSMQNARLLKVNNKDHRLKSGPE